MDFESLRRRLQMWQTEAPTNLLLLFAFYSHHSNRKLQHKEEKRFFTKQ